MLVVHGCGGRSTHAKSETGRETLTVVLKVGGCPFAVEKVSKGDPISPTQSHTWCTKLLIVRPSLRLIRPMTGRNGS